ncbi:MAG: SRPBCC family protein [Myxococcales bacterium]|nr:SRPBCC family protein [Myxococcales bacterium]
MSVQRLERVQRIARPRDEVFAFFERAENLERITPAFLRFSIVTPLPIEMREGATIDYRLSLFGVPLRWRTRIDRYEPRDSFVDMQVRGPYRLWRHTHTFEDVEGGTEMRDVVEYEVPFGPLGTLARWLFVSRTLERIFDHRAASIAEIFEA